jgi:hypothetical protein
MRIGNVFMSDCSSLVASDGNNKVKVLSLIKLTDTFPLQIYY